MKSFYSPDNIETINSSNQPNSVSSQINTASSFEPPLSFKKKQDLSYIDSFSRIAVYDDLLSSPKIVEIDPSETNAYIENLASSTYELSKAAGGSIPYTVIREVSENFIHADFIEPTISIFDKGNTIRFADQGPGIPKKDVAQLPGFTSASGDMKHYIRGVGSGLPIVKEYLSFTGGKLVIEDNIKNGTVITISIDNKTTSLKRNESSFKTEEALIFHRKLSEREKNVLMLVERLGAIGPSDIHDELSISISTAHRTLETLEEIGYVESTSTRKRILTDQGFAWLQKER